jgi:hypothetical protein
MAAWIRIRIPNADPYPGGLKSSKKGRGKNAYKRQIIRHIKDKTQCNLSKMGKCYFIFVESYLTFICLIKKMFFNVHLDLEPHESTFIFKARSGSAFA